MDEEASFANILAQSTTASRPQWSSTAAGAGPASPADDPWANPFAAGSAGGFGSTASPFGGPSASRSGRIPSFDAGAGFGAALGSPSASPYVQRLEDDERLGRGTLPDPPSVIAAREAEASASAAYLQGGFGSTDAARAFAPIDSPTLANDPFAQPFAPSVAPFRPASPPAALRSGAPASSPPVAPPSGPRSRGLPSDLIDEDLLAASDPSISLKKAFVKSAPPAAGTDSSTKPASAAPTPEKPKAYVFRPGGPAAARRESSEVVKKVQAPDPRGKSAEAAPAPAAAEPRAADGDVKKLVDGSQAAGTSVVKETASVVDNTPSTVVTAPTPSADEGEASRLGHDATSVPLPPSTDATPAVSRTVTPQPSEPAVTHEVPQAAATAEPVTPSGDRVAVSPLDGAHASEYGFKNLAIGGDGPSTTTASEATTTTAPAASRPEPAIADPMSSGWTSSLPNAGTSGSAGGPSRFGGKGWGSLDDEDETEGDGGLFGKGGPSLRISVPPPVWDTAAQDDTEGWGGENVAFQPARAPLQESEPPASTKEDDEEDAEDSAPLSSAINGSNRKKSSVFHVSVSDPAKVGDPVRGYTVYTVRTRTTSPHYRRGDFSVLRRFSDFLWLWDALTTNNPGIIVPPMPDKNALGRFQEQFIETRRAALQRSLSKITSHPVLQLDPDLRLFLESDSFATEIKHRPKPDAAAAEKQGLLAGWTGPKFVEQDEWFDARKQFLDSLEAQLRALSKAVEAASKSRLEIALSIEHFADSVTALAESDLGSAMCAALARLADLGRKEKEHNEEQAKADVVQVLNVADEYIRTIGSVRLAFAGRIKAYHTWQALEKDVVRLRQVREKARQQGKLGDRVQSSLAEIVDAERRARDAATEFDTISRLVKSEFARFERERIDEFRDMLQAHLDGLISRQKELIVAWEEHHALLLGMVKRAQVPSGQAGGSSAAA